MSTGQVISLARCVFCSRLCAAATACTSPHLIATPDAGDKAHDAGERDAATADAGFDAETLDSGSDAGQDAGAGAGPTCTCPDGKSLCLVEGECVKYCEVPALLPGGLARTDQDPRPKSAVLCAKSSDAEPDLTFDELCKRRCLIQCERQAWFCAADLTCAHGAPIAPTADRHGHRQLCQSAAWRAVPVQQRVRG